MTIAEESSDFKKLKKMIDALVEPRLYSLGEVMDVIEIGMIAISTSNDDELKVISVDKDGRLFNFNEETDQNGMTKISYGFGFRLKEDVPFRRFMLYKNLDIYYEIVDQLQRRTETSSDQHEN